MFRKMLLAMLLGAGSLPPAYAVEASLSVEIPRLQVAEYHRPYLAAWVREDQTGTVTNLALWYQIDEQGEGEKWLKDLRQWWRRSGRSLEMPIDGLTGATRAPGSHSIDLSGRLADLPAGAYTLHLESVREVGGRELLQLPFAWPPTEARTIGARGESELGAVTFEIHP